MNNTMVDTVNHIVTAQIPHLSTYAVVVGGQSLGTVLNPTGEPYTIGYWFIQTEHRVTSVVPSIVVEAHHVVVTMQQTPAMNGSVLNLSIGTIYRFMEKM